MEDKRDSRVDFRIVSALKGDQYKEFASKLIYDFMLCVDPEMDKRYAEALVERIWWNEESGIGNFQIDKENIGYLKMYLYDEDSPYAEELSGTIVFRDHYSHFDVIKVHLVSDHFEKFLKEQKVLYSRKNQMLPNR